MIDLTRADKPLCPLQSIGQAEPVPCAGKLCAWWDRMEGMCAAACVAENTGNMADTLVTLTEEEIPASDTDTDGDWLESLDTDDSYPTIPESAEVVNRGVPPKRIKVTISQEDGSPVFKGDDGPHVEYLERHTSVLLLLWKEGHLQTVTGNARWVMNFLLDELALPYA